MRVVVADASAIVEYLLGTDRGRPFAEVIPATDVSLHTPSLCDIEVVAVIRRALAAKVLDIGRANEALLDYLDLPISRHGHVALIGRMLQLRTNFSSYDASYVALAERLGAEFVTSDEALARATSAHTSIVVRR